jgi:quinoprotein glucose dehydrogenase
MVMKGTNARGSRLLVRSLYGLVVAGLFASGATVAAAAGRDWSVYGGDSGNSRYSSLAQITPGNVSRLTPAWTWDSKEPAVSFETTPLVIGRVMYVSTPRERVVALDKDTGAEIWSFDPKVASPSTHRGVSYWPGDAKNPPRIVFGTSDGKMFALDASTGAPIASFGQGGVIDFKARLGGSPRVLSGFSSPPVIYKDLVIFGPRTAESGPAGPDAAIRAIDVRTGKQVWQFHTLPRPGEPGYDTWGPDFWKTGGGPSAWAPFTLDLERGVVFVPVGNPTGGGDPDGRKGNNLYSDSLVALNAATGKLLWSYQMVHHDIWDYDMPASPTLVTVVRNGRKIPAVAQITKNSLLFILDRATGKPIFGVEERPVPTGAASGEALSPTQPFPLKPEPLARQSITPAEVSRLSPESEAYCRDLLADRDSGGPFVPRGPRGAVFFPSTIGGGNWGGVSYDAAHGLIFVNSSSLGAISSPRAVSSDETIPAAAPGTRPAAARRPTGNRFIDEDRYPCNQPPWGQLFAIDANSGNIVWRTVLGGYKALEAKGVTDAGAVNTGPSLITAGGVLFIGATNDGRFRAFDARSGKLLWTLDMDGDALAGPMTYLDSSGRQMLVVATGGPSYLGGVGPAQPTVTGKLTVLALPAGSPGPDQASGRKAERK